MTSDLEGGLQMRSLGPRMGEERKMMYVQLMGEEWEDIGSYANYNIAQGRDPPHLGAILRLPNIASPLDIFLSIFDMDLVEALFRVGKKEGIPMGQAYILLGMRCYLLGKGKARTAARKVNVVQWEYTELKKELDQTMGNPRHNNRTLIPGFSLFNKMLGEYLLDSYITRTSLSERFLRILNPGRHIHLSSKLKSYFRKGRICSLAPSHLTHRNHWMVQLCGSMEGTGLPILFACYPDIDKMGSAEDEVTRAWKWADHLLKTSRSERMICADAPFTSVDQVKLCRELELMWVGELMQSRFIDFKNMVESNGIGEEEHVSLYNRVGGESFCYCLSRDYASHQGYLMTNIINPSPGPDTNSPAHMLSHLYDSMCKIGDQFNRLLVGKWWPYNRRSWEKHMDSYLFSATLLNCYHIWKSLGDISERARVPFNAFCIDLAKQILSWAKNKFYPISPLS